MCGCRTWKHPTEARSCVALNLIWAETAKTKTAWEKQMATQHMTTYDNEFKDLWQHIWMVSVVIDWLIVSGFGNENKKWCQLYCKLSIFSQAQVSSHASGSGALMQLHWVARDYILWFMELGEQKSFISVNLDIRSRDHLVIQLFQLQLSQLCKLETWRDILNCLRILLRFDMSCDEGCLINLRHVCWCVAWTNISCGGIRGVSSQCSDQLSSFVFTESFCRDVVVCHGCTVPGTEATSQEACCHRWCEGGSWWSIS